MKLLQALSGLVGLTAALSMPGKRAVSFDWSSTKVRGVNLGGWLVLEPWITPSLFNAAGPNAVDEWTFCETLGKPEALRRLQKHWDSWVTLQDFQKIKNAGFNVVRIPIGYWAFMDIQRPYVQGAAPYIDKAIGWARQTGLKIIIDLHGAPQSQNGWDHSGHRMAKPGWGDAVSQSLTLTVLQSISKWAQKPYQDVVVAIELLNEPLISSLDANAVRNFYRNGYNLFRGVSDTPVLLHDGFWAPSAWNGFLSWPAAYNVIMDHHEYQCFDNNLLGMTPEQHNQQVCSSTKAFSGADKWEIVGEWSAALTDCAVSINGRGFGARYDGTFPGSTRRGSCAGINSISSWTQAQKDSYRKYIETQIDTYERKTNGWVFWNFKTESSPEWDMFKLLDAGLFPQPLTSRKFPRVCP